MKQKPSKTSSKKRNALTQARLKAKQLSFALVMACAPLANSCLAQSVPASSELRLKYVNYFEYQAGRESRMKIQSPMLWIDSPLSDSVEFEGSLLLDSMSGASPLFLDTLSGASGEGVTDDRWAGDAKVTKYFEDFSLMVGGAWSDEDDYLSRSGVLDSKIWSADKNTTLELGFSADWDELGSSNNPDLDEGRNTQHYLVGVTQVLSPVDIIQNNLTYAHGHGYYNDPYKTPDTRPGTREQWAWLTRYNHYIEAWDAALHLDYRFYGDTWDVFSHMLAARLYQPVTKEITLVPITRYYIQDESNFFSGTIPTTFSEGPMSLDERLGSYGTFTIGLKTIAKITNDLQIDLLYEYYSMSRGLKPGDESSDWKHLYAHYFELGLLAKF